MAEVEREDLNAAELAVLVAIGEINETGRLGFLDALCRKRDWQRRSSRTRSGNGQHRFRGNSAAMIRLTPTDRQTSARFSICAAFASRSRRAAQATTAAKDDLAQGRPLHSRRNTASGSAVGFAAGGSADILARLMGQWSSERLGQQFIVENRTGAGTKSRPRPSRGRQRTSCERTGLQDPIRAGRGSSPIF
jgi:hypothetical protein